MAEETEIWNERAGLMDAIVHPLGLINLVLLPIIWLARLSDRYTLTNQRLIINKGLLSRSVDEIELFRVKDVTLTQTLFQRFVGYGTITVSSTDASGTFEITHLPKAYARREELRRQVFTAREAMGVRTLAT